jgi:hypothetical protein
MKLKKYKVVNMPQGTRRLVGSQLPGGQMPIDQLTDDIAERLYNQGSRYVALAKTPENTSKKQDK